MGILVVSSLGYYKLCYDGHLCTRLRVNTFLLGEHQEAGLLGQRAECSALVCASHHLQDPLTFRESGGNRLEYGAK